MNSTSEVIAFIKGRMEAHRLWANALGRLEEKEVHQIKLEECEAILAAIYSHIKVGED